jgi:threonine synthase
MSIWRFADHLPPIPERCQITLGEGDTPLLRSRRIGPSLGLQRLFFKIESSNPTGSYKDRFAACAVSQLRADNAPICLGTSSGNAGAAMAAYCAAIQLPCVIAIVESAPAGKLRQMLAYGAELFPIRGFGTNAQATRQVMSDLQQLATELNTHIQISAFKYAPQGMVGVETISPSA